MYEIVLTDSAKGHFTVLSARMRAMVKEGVIRHLTQEPMKESRSRIKRLRDLRHPGFRLRLDPYRVFYDVTEHAVVILAIVPKEETAAWLDSHGEKPS